MRLVLSASPTHHRLRGGPFSRYLWGGGGGAVVEEHMEINKLFPILLKINKLFPSLLEITDCFLNCQK